MVLTPQQFAEKQGLKKKIEEDMNPYIVYALMDDYSKYLITHIVTEFNERNSVDEGEKSFYCGDEKEIGLRKCQKQCDECKQLRGFGK